MYGRSSGPVQSGMVIGTSIILVHTIIREAKDVYLQLFDVLLQLVPYHFWNTG